jgi:hypothetical protein
VSAGERSSCAPSGSDTDQLNVPPASAAVDELAEGGEDRVIADRATVGESIFALG